MNDTNFARLSEVYRKHLHIVVEKYPDEYFGGTYDKNRVEEIADRCMAALVRNSFNASDSVPLRTACKELGIPHTTKAVTAFLEII